jgi:lysozyme
MWTDAELKVVDLASEWVKRHEGLRLKPYRCTAGKLTIGYGRNLEDRGITIDEANNLLRTDLRLAYTDARELAGTAWETMSERRKAVLVDMSYNLGRWRLSRFVQMWAAIRAGDYVRASREMKSSVWATQVGGRAAFLASVMEAG